MNQSKSNELKSGRSLVSAIAIAILALFVISGSILAQEGTQMISDAKPTIVLVHGAFADSSSWTGVTRILLDDGYRVVAAANPLRGVSGDDSFKERKRIHKKRFIGHSEHGYETSTGCDYEPRATVSMG
jgi:pimeloyl-ACP methyl ester carboxylesterase